MAKSKSESNKRHKFSNSMNIELWAELNELSDDTGITIARFLDRGAELVLEEYKDHPLKKSNK